ncbi:MAG: hypothetical protein QM492_08845 [Rhodobacterales bacterium]
MKKTALIITFATIAPSLAAAGCYADYKAKQSASGLKLHYGVMQLSGGACNSRAKAQAVVAKRLANGGWQLLTLLSIFDQSGLSQRQNNAGAYFLRY